MSHGLLSQNGVITIAFTSLDHEVVSLLRTLFKKPPCELCGSRPSSVDLLLPNQQRKWACKPCADECDEIFGNAIRSFEVEAMVNEIDVDENFI